MQNVPCYVFCKIRRRRQECDHEVFGWAKLTLSAVASIFASTMAAPVQVIPPGPTAEAEQAPALDIDEHNTIKGIDVDKLDWTQLHANRSALEDSIREKKRARKLNRGAVV